ncbi:chalcone isomerase family protein [Idiomarina seosinensis]|uniref:chalcone isomerase family protein n=1 Tax=Idiomarina seosinensis TaxID=281739 RepID=UPI00384C70CA
MKTLVIWLFLLIPFSAAVHASSCEQSLPEQFKRVGETRLSVWFWDVYDATLYTEKGSFSWQDRKQLNKALLLDYLRDIKAADLVETTAEEWDKLGFSHPERSNWLEQLSAIWPDIKEGDCLLLRESDDGYAEFYQDDKKLGVVEHETFTEQFLAIWLSPDSRFKDERQELTGEK